MVEFAGVIRNSPEGQIPKASSGLSGWRRLPNPTVGPVPCGLKALKLEKLASRKTSGSAATTGIAIPSAMADLAPRSRSRRRSPAMKERAPSRSRIAMTSNQTTVAPSSQARPGKL